MPWNIVVAALLVLAAAFGALGASLGLALLLGGARWPEAQADGLRWSGAVSRNPPHAALGDPTRESTDQAGMLCYQSTNPVPEKKAGGTGDFGIVTM